MIAEYAEIREAFGHCHLQCHGGGWGRRFEAYREEDDLAGRIVPRDFQRFERRPDHADIAAGGFGLEQAHAMRTGNPHHVAIGAENNAVIAGKLDTAVDPADRKDADRATRPVNEADRGRQHRLKPVSGNGMGVSAAEFHKAVAAAGLAFGGDGRRDPACEASVAKLRGEFHPGRSSGSSSASSPISLKSASVSAAS